MMDNLFGISLTSILLVLNIMLLVLGILYENSNKKAIKELKTEQRERYWRIIQILAGVQWFAYRQKDGKIELRTKYAINGNDSFIGGNKLQLFDEVEDENK